MLGHAMKIAISDHDIKGPYTVYRDRIKFACRFSFSMLILHKCKYIRQNKFYEPLEGAIFL